jgi:hypothetical protein
MYNREIRKRAAESGIKLWQIADALGMNDGNFSRKLRKELPDEEKQKIIEIIRRLTKEVAKCGKDAHN